MRDIPALRSYTKPAIGALSAVLASGSQNQTTTYSAPEARNIYVPVLPMHRLGSARRSGRLLKTRASRARHELSLASVRGEWRDSWASSSRAGKGILGKRGKSARTAKRDIGKKVYAS